MLLKIPFARHRSTPMLLVDQSEPVVRFLVVANEQKQLKLLLKGQLVRDEDMTVAQQIRRRLDESGIRCSQTALLLARPAVEFYSGSMPPANDHELPSLVENFVIQEADDGQQRVVDYVVTGGDGETTVDILAVTCEREVIQSAAKQFKEAGLKLSVATYHGFGAVQLIHQVAHQKLPITIAITSSDSSTEIAVLQQRQPVLFRTLQRGLQSSDSYATALTAEIQRTLAFLGAGDEDSALIYLMGRHEDLSEVAEVMSETVSSSVTITGILDSIDATDVEPFDDVSSFAQLIGIAFAIAQSRLSVNFLEPRKPVAESQSWHRPAAIGGAAAVIGAMLLGYQAWNVRHEQLQTIEKRRQDLKNWAQRVNKSAELKDIVDRVDGWQRTDITWLDELKELSDRFPERNESLVRKLTMSATDNGTGVVELSVQVNSPEVITELESAIRDDRHSVVSKRVTEVNDSDQLTWSFDTRIVFQPLPRPENWLPEPIGELTVDGVSLDEPESERETESNEEDAGQQDQSPPPNGIEP